MRVGELVKTSDGKKGIVTCVLGSAVEVWLDSGGYAYRHVSTLTLIPPASPDDKAGKAVEELESLPTDGCKYHSSPPQGPPDSIESHSVESVPEKTWKDYNSDWLGTDVDDGVEVEILSARRKNVMGFYLAELILLKLTIARHIDG